MWKSHDRRSASLPRTRSFRRAFAILFAIPVILFVVTFLWLVTGNQYLTEYRIDINAVGEGYAYQHEDARSTNNYRYLIRTGALPKEEELPLYRQYVRAVRIDSGMSVPSNIFKLNKEQVDLLAVEWYQEKFPGNPTDTIVLQTLIHTLFVQAINEGRDKQSIRNKADVENIWRLLKSLDSPKLRWVGDDDRFIPWLVVYSAGDKHSFYDPTTNTIYLSYNRSLYMLADEIGHVKQFRDHPISSYTHMVTSFVSAYVEAGFSIEQAKLHYKNNYKNPSSFEGLAHGQIKQDLLKTHHLEHLEEEVSK